jgi:hypothetical protein
MNKRQQDFWNRAFIMDIKERGFTNAAQTFGVRTDPAPQWFIERQKANERYWERRHAREAREGRSR